VGLTVFQTLYGQIDPIVLGMLANETTVGWYAVAFRLIGTTLFIPIAINSALLPTLSRLYASNKAQFTLLAQQMLTLVMLCGVPVATLLIIAPHRILDLLHYPAEFAGSIPILRIGGATSLLYYMTVVFGAIVIASDRQAHMLSVFAKSCLIGIPACLIFTFIGHRFYQNGAIGAILSDTLLEIYLVISFIVVLKDCIAVLETLTIFVKLVLAAVPMALLLLWATSPSAPGIYGGGLWAMIPGLVLYVAGCLFLRCINGREYIALLRDVLSRRTQGVRS
jgi:O-antigen/teichoic acid export membrane protein